MSQLPPPQPPSKQSDNPYNAPAQEYAPNSYAPARPSGGAGIVNQLLVIGILMIVQGVLLLLMSALAFFYAFGLTAIMENAPNNGPPPPAEAIFWIRTVGAAFGAIVLLLATMHFLSAYWTINIKGRIFSITTLILGLGASLTFYCAPTAIGLCIYGLIILFHPASRHAYQLGESGMSREQILQQFYR